MTTTRNRTTAKKKANGGTTMSEIFPSGLARPLSFAIPYHIASAPFEMKHIKSKNDSLLTFTLDPGKPLAATTTSFPSRFLVKRAVDNAGILEPRIQQTVLDFSGVYGSTVHHKVVRDRARASMAANRPHWSVLHYGNAGVIEYHGDSRQSFDGYKLGVEYDTRG